ncbi:hypothetical protein BEP19_13050 [Ammoniphilus oxalaticus]|uniref:ABC transporter substrate-binding protein n=1 Tax=Ammoniphilus oxalaticus TaxID=66863 RepID=A0A419SH77_9BACL|nr:transporter substrate-binding domain-containing protein [Ammoniphilus oxalaticus]RKD23139.1 hypothetical protein BEP19_13050 [Ammoniphilus oxalaticus]
MRKSVLTVFGLFMILSMALVGCGGSASVDTAEGETNAEPGDTTDGKLLDPNKFHFAMSGVYKPYNYVNEKNELEGFDVDIAHEIAKRMELEPVSEQLPWDSLIMELKSGKFDAITASMAITDDRLKEVDFTRPYYLSQAVMFVHEDNADKIRSKEDLEGKKVGVVAASTFKEAAEKLIGPEGEVVEYTSDLLALEELKDARRLDAVITDLGVGQHAIEHANLPAIAVGEALFVDKIGIAVQKGNQELLDELNEALEAMIEDGTYLKISEEWFNEDMLEEK